LTSECEGEPVASPCTSICTIDGATGLCAGCFRTLDEIASWIDLSDVQRRSLLAELVARQRRLGNEIDARRSGDGKR
jgi:predicted Fe-S protein YdhL (DUF1289 family)